MLTHYGSLPPPSEDLQLESEIPRLLRLLTPQSCAHYSSHFLAVNLPLPIPIAHLEDKLRASFTRSPTSVLFSPLIFLVEKISDIRLKEPLFFPSHFFKEGRVRNRTTHPLFHLCALSPTFLLLDRLPVNLPLIKDPERKPAKSPFAFLLVP